VIHNVHAGAAIASEPASAIDRLARETGASREGCIATSEFSVFLAEVLHKLDAVAATAAPPAAAAAASVPAAPSASTPPPAGPHTPAPAPANAAAALAAFAKN
jgi:hypothetical protein